MSATRIAAAERQTFTLVNPTDLPPIDRETLVAGPSDGIWTDGENAPRLFERYGAEFMDDPDGVRLFREQDVGPAVYESPPDFAVGIGKAVLAGYRTFLTGDGRFFCDEVFYDAELVQRRIDRLSVDHPFANECTGLRPVGGGAFRFAARDRPVRRLRGTVVVMLSDEPLSYGSFLFRFLPKVQMLREFGLGDFKVLTHMPSDSCRELLNLAGIPDAHIIQHDLNAITTIDRAVVLGLSTPNTYFDPRSCKLFAELRRAYGPAQQTRKIYVSRYRLNSEGWSTRIMRNEAELIARLTAMGFDIVEPETLPVREQIHAFASAAMVVGPSGSGLFNTVFCHPGTKMVDIQSEDHWVYSYAGMYASLGLRYGFFIGKADRSGGGDAHWPWEIDIDALIARIETFLAV